MCRLFSSKTPTGVWSFIIRLYLLLELYTASFSFPNRGLTNKLNPLNGILSTFRLTDTGKLHDTEYHKGYALLFLLVKYNSRCTGLCFYTKSWVSSRQPMSQPQPLKPHGVVGHSSVPALGVLTQGSNSSLGGGRAYLGALLSPAVIAGCRGWGA